jgi:glycosyltransferase involved in cell wall biosynthesis
LKILQVHNSYLNFTGDDAVVEEEKKLLEAHGHTVIQYVKSNTEITQGGIGKKIRTGLSLKSSKVIRKEFAEILKKHRPEIVHAHNIFPLITPVIFEICNSFQVPVIQTLHNYRLLCVNTLFYRGGHICEDCLKFGDSRGIMHKCYNDSWIQSWLMTEALRHHYKQGTWTHRVDAYICLSSFARSRFVQKGIPKEKLIVKPNFVNVSQGQNEYSGNFFYAGKLENQKGIDEFIRLAKKMPEVSFTVAGFSPNPGMLDTLSNVDYLGEIPRDRLMKEMSHSNALLFLSRMYEGMPMTILEAFALKKPVIARKQGAMSEMIEHNRNGFLYENELEIEQAILKLSSIKTAESMGSHAFENYKKLYSQKQGYKNLMDIYQRVIDSFER